MSQIICNCHPRWSRKWQMCELKKAFFIQNWHCVKIFFLISSLCNNPVKSIPPNTSSHNFHYFFSSLQDCPRCDGQIPKVLSALSKNDYKSIESEKQELPLSALLDLSLYRYAIKKERERKEKRKRKKKELTNWIKFADDRW